MMPEASSFMGKYCNLLKIISGYLLSLLTHRVIHFGNPISISIEPTNQCNLQCPECPTGQHGLTRLSGSIDTERFKSYLDQVGKKLLYLVLYFQGEPYLNKQLFDLIAYAKSKNIFVWTSTNGHFLSEKNIRQTIHSRLDKLVISLDGVDQQTYSQYRIGGDYEKVVQGIKEFVRIKKEMGVTHPTLEIQFLVLKPNQHQIKEIKELGRSLGVDRTVLKTAQFYDFKHGNPLMPDEGRWSRYRKKSQVSRFKSQVGVGHAPPVRNSSSPPDSYRDHQFIPKNRLWNRCFRMWSGCVITWDGRVVPCCFDKDSTYCLGDLNKESFEEIWRGEKYKEFRKNILKNRKSIDICRNCSQRW